MLLCDGNYFEKTNITLLGAGGPGHDEVTAPGIGRKQAVISDEMDAWSRHQGGETSDEVMRFEQHVSGAIGESMFEFVDHQPAPQRNAGGIPRSRNSALSRK